MFITCLWCIKHNNDGHQTVRFFNIAAVVLAAVFTLFVYISKWNALYSNNKFKTTESLRLLCRLLNTQLIFSHQPAWIKTWTRFFSAPNSTDPGKHYDSIHIRHPDYERILKSTHSKSWKIESKTIDTILVSSALLKHAKRINILVILFQYLVKCLQDKDLQKAYRLIIKP